MKLHLRAVALLVVAFGPMADAAIIDLGTYTTDTNLGLDYLDVGLVHGAYSVFGAGVVYGGRTWQLATAVQLASTWSGATGLALTPAHIFSSDNDMGFAATNILINLFDGVTTDRGVSSERVIGDYSIDDYYNFIFGGQLAVHDVFDDSHYVADTGGFHSAWLVAPTQGQPTPEPATWSALLFGLGAIIAHRVRK